MKRKPKHMHKEDRPEAAVTSGQVTAHLAKLSKPASIREIAHGMGLKHVGRRFLPRVIHQLARDGEIEQNGGRYKLAGARHAKNPTPARERTASRPAPAPHQPPKRAHDPNLVAGRLVEHRRPDGRAEGRVVQIVERENPTIVGLFRYGPHGNHVLPYDTRIHHEVLIPPGEELTPELRRKLGATSTGEPVPIRRLRIPELDGAVVDAEITRFPKGGLSPAGRVLEILGRPGDIGVDTEIIIRKHHLPHIFPEEVLAEARSAPQQVGQADLLGRRDFRDLPIVTIDGETARDFDDAVHVAQLASGGYELQVHIADVAHYVRRGSPLDREARVRGTSVYFPSRAVPMLPEELSNGICSLNPQVDRLVMSVLMEMDASGNMVHAEFTPGVIRSAERMTYTNVHKVLE